MATDIPPPDPEVVAWLRADLLAIGTTEEQADAFIDQILAARAATDLPAQDPEVDGGG